MIILIPDLFKSAGSHTSLPIRGYCQTDSFRCGLSAAWAVVKYFQPEASFSSFCDICEPLPKWGLSTRKMMNCLRKQGLHVKSDESQIWIIQNAIIAGCPILTTIEGPNNDDHWIVIHGFTRSHVLFAGRVLPGFTKKKMRWEKFLARCNSQILMVYD
jgi:Papain-like cysteine protease AvrRpt2